jgi:uncharacterized lipoprotein
MKPIKIALIFICLCLTGCSSWHKYSYNNSPYNQGFENLPTIKAPPDLSAEELKPYYPIPQIKTKDAGKPPSLKPPIE